MERRGASHLIASHRIASPGGEREGPNAYEEGRQQPPPRELPAAAQPREEPCRPRGRAAQRRPAPPRPPGLRWARAEGAGRAAGRRARAAAGLSVPGRCGPDAGAQSGAAAALREEDGGAGVEVAAHPAARGGQRPRRLRPLLALHLPRVPAARREGDRSGGADAAGQGVEEEPHCGRRLQVAAQGHAGTGGGDGGERRWGGGAAVRAAPRSRLHPRPFVVGARGARAGPGPR